MYFFHNYFIDYTCKMLKVFFSITSDLMYREKNLVQLFVSEQIDLALTQFFVTIRHLSLWIHPMNMNFFTTRIQ